MKQSIITRKANPCSYFYCQFSLFRLLYFCTHHSRVFLVIGFRHLVDTFSLKFEILSVTYFRQKLRLVKHALSQCVFLLLVRVQLIKAQRNELLDKGAGQKMSMEKHLKILVFPQIFFVYLLFIGCQFGS